MVGHVTVAAEDALRQTRASRLVKTDGTSETSVQVRDINCAVGDVLWKTNRGVTGKVETSGAVETNVRSCGKDTTVGDVDSLTTVVSQVVSGLTGSALVSVADVSGAVSDVLKGTHVETVNVVVGIADETLVLVQLVGLAVRE